MIFYRVESRDDSDEHLGFTWFASRRMAEAFAKDPPDADTATTIEVFNVGTTKAALLDFLNDVASHPDNG